MIFHRRPIVFMHPGLPFFRMKRPARLGFFQHAFCVLRGVGARAILGEGNALAGIRRAVGNHFAHLAKRRIPAGIFVVAGMIGNLIERRLQLVAGADDEARGIQCLHDGFEMAQERVGRGRLARTHFIEQPPKGNARMVVTLEDQFAQLLFRIRAKFRRVAHFVHERNFVPQQ